MYSYAWETQDGQKWLAKALDPAGMQTVDLKGLPDQESHNVVVLNYQSQFVVDPPQMYNAPANDASTFESEMYLYQDPVVFGTAASYPTGTMDPLGDTNKVVSISFGCTKSGSEAAPKISFPQTSGVPFPRTCKRFINTQLGGKTTISEAYDNLKSFSQRHRMIYGAAQLIPTCSAQDNSGSISVSQQPFVGDSFNEYTVEGRLTKDNTAITDIATCTRTRNPLSAYYPNDFPDTEDNIRNPASLMTRFYEGAYIPYKLKNPFHEDFINSSDARVTAAPFWVCGAAYRKYGETAFTKMDWDAAGHCFTSNLSGGVRIKADCDRLKLVLMSRTGAIKEIVFVNSSTITPGTTTEPTAIVNLATANVLSTLEGDEELKKLLADNNQPNYGSVQLSHGGTPDVDGGGAAVFAGHVYRTGEEDLPRARLPGSNLAAVLCKSMNMKGNITCLIRMGMETVVTAASTYSPFNHKSPAYDESAIKSYLRVVHRMSDAFYGNAAADYFHASYYNYIIAQLYHPDDTVDFANRGSYWRGVVKATM